MGEGRCTWLVHVWHLWRAADPAPARPEPRRLGRAVVEDAHPRRQRRARRDRAPGGPEGGRVPQAVMPRRVQLGQEGGGGVAGGG